MLVGQVPFFGSFMNLKDLTNSDFEIRRVQVVTGSNGQLNLLISSGSNR